MRRAHLLSLPVALLLSSALPRHAAAQAPAQIAAEPPAVEPRPSSWVDRPAAMDRARFRPGKGLELASEDGDFAVAMKVRAQILYTFENADGAGAEDAMEVRRARLAFQGNLFGKHNRYKMELAVSPRDAQTRGGATGTAPLLDWFMTFDHVKAATLVAGQYKIPFSRQRLISSGSLQMVDRSIVQNEFNLDRNVGFDLRSTDLLDRRAHYFLGLYPTEQRNGFEAQELGLLYLARFELLPLGAFDDYSEADLDRTEKPGLSIAGSYAYQDNAARNQGTLGSHPADGGTTDYHHVAADILFKMMGFSLTSEVFYRNGKRKRGGAVDDMMMPIAVEAPRNGYGMFVQAGYLLPMADLEVSARYGLLRKRGSNTSLSNRNELGGGLSYYFARHSFKLQGDYFRRWDDDGPGKGDDFVRLQLEAGF